MERDLEHLAVHSTASHGPQVAQPMIFLFSFFTEPVGGSILGYLFTVAMTIGTHCAMLFSGKKLGGNGKRISNKRAWAKTPSFFFASFLFPLSIFTKFLSQTVAHNDHDHTNGCCWRSSSKPTSSVLSLFWAHFTYVHNSSSQPQYFRIQSTALEWHTIFL